MAVLEKLHWPTVLIVAPLTAVDLVWVTALQQSPYLICRNREELKGASGPVALVVHWQLFTKTSKQLAKLPWQVLIIDESQGLKNRNSLQSRAARRFRDAVPRRIALSGTPIDESEIDVWSQMRFIDHTVLGEDWTPFAEEYCYKAGFMGHEWRFNKDKQRQFLDKLKNHIYRLTVDFLKLKPIQLHPVPFHLLGNQRKLYEDMRDNGVIEVGGVRIVAPLSITVKSKLEQITGGLILDEDDISRPTGGAKARKLKWLANRLKPPVVIFCLFSHEIPLIRKSLPWSHIRSLHGGIKGEERVQLIRDFQAGKVDALICQLRTGGVAIDLTRSCELIFYSINHSFIDFEQVLFRLYGKNQKKVLNAYLLFAVDTVDEEKIKVIEGKKSSVYQVVSHFERK